MLRLLVNGERAMGYLLCRTHSLIIMIRRFRLVATYLVWPGIILKVRLSFWSICFLQGFSSQVTLNFKCLSFRGKQTHYYSSHLDLVGAARWLSLSIAAAAAVLCFFKCWCGVISHFGCV